MTSGFPGAVLNVKIGDGSYLLSVDTASANTWVGANQTNPYRPSNASSDTGQDVLVTYGSGNFTGHQFTVFRGNSHNPLGQQVHHSGLMILNSDLEGFDGLFGMGPRIITNGTLHPNRNELVPTVTDNLVSSDIIQRNMTALFVPPLVTNEDTRADFEGINTDGLTTEINFVPNTKVSDINHFWAVNQTITFGEAESEITLSEEGQGIMDSGTTLIRLEANAFKIYTEAVGAVFDNATALFRVDDPTLLKSINYHIGDRTYQLTPDAQILPRSLNSLFGGVENGTYLMIDSGETTSTNGWIFMQRFYTVFDGDNDMVGVAETVYTHAILNG